MLCPKCHQEIQEDAIFCSQCGMKIERCPHCQKPIMSNARFCTYCGKPLSEQSSSQTIGGYYQPIQDTVFQTETKTENQIKSTSKKVNKPIVIGSIVVLMIASVVSFLYLRNTPPVPVSKKHNETMRQFEIKGQNDPTAMIGNSNQGGHVATYQNKYYVVNDQGQLVSMDKTTSHREVLIDDNVEYVNIVNDNIYYTNKDHHICSSDINGKNQKVLVNMKAYYVIVVNQKIYYQSDTDGEKIYVYDINTHQNMKLNDRHSYNLNIIDKSIYYTSLDGIYRIGIDGQGDEKLVSGKCSQAIYQDGKIYYSEDNTQVKSYDCQSKQITQIIDEKAVVANMNKDYLFFYTVQGLKKYDFTTHQITNVYNHNIQYLEILGDKLVLTINDKQTYRMIMDFNGQNQQRLFMSQDGNFV